MHPSDPDDSSSRRSGDESLLWTLSSEIAEEGAPAPSDELLRAYRDNRLETPEAEQVEQALAHSAVARQRLAKLSRVQLAGPSAAARQRYLFALPRPARRPAKVWWRTAAAAAAVIAMLSGYGWVTSRDTARVSQGLRPDSEFSVRVLGLADVRSLEGDDARKLFYPDTTLTLIVEARTHGTAGLDYGLYLEHEGEVRRQQLGKRLKREIHRGTATFTATAADLLGSEPGTYRLFVVISDAGDLPADPRLAPGEDAATALGAGNPDRRVVGVQVTLLSPPPDQG